MSVHRSSSVRRSAPVRRRVLLAAALGVAATGAVATPAVAAGNGDLASRPANFGPALYADGEVWGTNGNGLLPAPKGNNTRSYDPLYVFTNGATGQLPVAEAAPGNPDYNGGRWTVMNVTWVDPVDATVLTSDDQVHMYAMAGKLTVTDAEFYFSCPLLPVK